MKIFHCLLVQYAYEQVKPWSLHRELVSDKNEGKHDHTLIEQTHANAATSISCAIVAMTMQGDKQEQHECYILHPPTIDKLL